VNFVWDTLTGINLVLCIAIVAIGYLAWKRTGSRLILLVGGAFALFGISHLASLFSLNDDLEQVLIFVRVAAYILVALALLMEARRKKPAPAEE
jgi:hypothetical protein